MTRRILSLRFPWLAVERFIAARRAHQLANPVPWWDEQRAARTDNPEERIVDADADSEDPDAPLVLISQGPKGTRISGLSPAAAEAGLWVDQRLGDARAMLPKLRVEPHDSNADHALLRHFAHWAMRWSPQVAFNIAPPNKGGALSGLLIDTTGCDHLFGGEAGLCADIEERFGANGYSVRIGLAHTPGAAIALSDYASAATSILPPDNEDGDRACAPLHGFPVEALRLDDETITLLKRLGLKTIGDAMAVPRLALDRRFRQSRSELTKKSTQKAGRRPSASLSAASAKAVRWRLDQLIGDAREPLSWVGEIQSFSTRFNCPQMAQDHEAVGVALAAMAPALCADLDKAGMGARHFRLTGYRADGGTSSTDIYLSAPGRDAATIRRLFKDRLERIDCGFGVDLFILTAMRTQALDARQPAMADLQGDTAGGSSHAVHLAHFADTLANRIDRAAIYRLAPRASHVPERAQRCVPAGADMAKIRASDPAAISKVPATRSPRPSRLFERPEAAHVTAPLPDGPPAQFIWRKRVHRVMRARGPERILPEWWADRIKSKPGALVRDYYDVEDAEGQRYWIFRAGYAAPPSLETPMDSQMASEAEAETKPQELEEASAEPVVPAPFAGEMLLPPAAAQELGNDEPDEWRWFVHGIF
ncbi:MAG: DNA polymerase Y family protein [Pseudomonadota bacterium]